jgi:PKD repeat protein
MTSKLHFWNGRKKSSNLRGQGSASRAVKKRLLRHQPSLGIECLEDRCLLSINPVLMIEPGQFFGAGGSFTPFRAYFTDVDDGTVQTFDYSIDWGDASPIDYGNTTRFRTQSSFLDPPGTQPPIIGIFEADHIYTSPGEYTVTVTLTDGMGGSDTAQTVVSVYPVDEGLRFDGVLEPVLEGTPFSFSLRTTTSGPPQTVEDISSWKINWGDSIELIGGNPESVIHTYGDDDFLPADAPDFPGTRRITAAATGSNGTFFAFSGNYVVIEDVPTEATGDGPSDINEGEVYTLNLSAIDPGDPIDGWIVFWGDESEFVTIEDAAIPGNPLTLTHVYADGDASYTIVAAPFSGMDVLSLVIIPVTVHNVAPSADNATFFLPEDSPNGTIVGNVPAFDPGDDVLTFTVLGGTGTAALAVDSATGEITVADDSLLDANAMPVLTLEIEVTDDDGGIDYATITVNVVKLASISGIVYVDVNQNGLFDGNEPGIDGVAIHLLDQDGNPVLDELGDPIVSITTYGGIFLFEGLNAGTYQLFEIQPTGVNDGAEHLGSLGGTILANDRMQLTLAGVNATDYAFAELGLQVTAGDTAGVGYWQSRQGQTLITQGGSALATWLTESFPNVFGNSLAGASGSDVAAFYRDQVFRQLSRRLPGPKVDAQFMATAFATFFTSRFLAGEVAASYGFNVTDTGIGTKIVNVGTRGAAFGVANGTDLTILQLLLATNSLTHASSSGGFSPVYDSNGDGVINSAEAALRKLANQVYASINDAGGI